MTTTHTVANTILDQLGGAGPVAAMTGAQLVAAEDSLTLVFRRQVGSRKLTHLTVAYDRGADLYNVTAHKLNRRTFEMTKVTDLAGIGAAELREACEQLTGLAFTL